MWITHITGLGGGQQRRRGGGQPALARSNAREPILDEHVHAEVSTNLAIRSALLAYFERAHATLGDGFELTAASTMSPSRACGVARSGSTVRPRWNGVVGKASSWH